MTAAHFNSKSWRCQMQRHRWNGESCPLDKSLMIGSRPSALSFRQKNMKLLALQREAEIQRKSSLLNMTFPKYSILMRIWQNAPKLVRIFIQMIYIENFETNFEANFETGSNFYSRRGLHRCRSSSTPFSRQNGAGQWEARTLWKTVVRQHPGNKGSYPVRSRAEAISYGGELKLI